MAAAKCVSHQEEGPWADAFKLCLLAKLVWLKPCLKWLRLGFALASRSCVLFSDSGSNGRDLFGANPARGVDTSVSSAGQLFGLEFQALSRQSLKMPFILSWR